jgi:hypothetical protein
LLDEAGWDLLIRQARRTRLQGRIAATVQDLGIADRIPSRAAGMLTAARYVAAENARMLNWEIGRIHRVLAGLGLPLVLLKGAAYAAAGLPPARGRLASDVDILVPRARLGAVEAALRDAGWEPIKLEPYDQRYYRDWMHELPPLQHAARGSVIDVHHTILPPTGRVQPDADRLWREAIATPTEGVRVLTPEDMILHSAAHLFQDGDLNFAIRDLVDLVDLLRHFGRDPAFWDRLLQRAALHDLNRTLFYALRYGERLLALDVPDSVARAMAQGAPPALVLRLMDRLAPRVLLPDHPDEPGHGRAGEALLLYMRSHWLRMPPWMLAAHLSHAAWRRLCATVLRLTKGKDAEEE